jgi:hypothetical protein
MPLLQRVLTGLLGPADPIARAELMNQKIREREINELETQLLLTPSSDAPDAPVMWDPQVQRAFFKGTAMSLGVLVYITVYATGILHA